MKGKMLGLVLVAVLGLMAVTPASADGQKPFNGDMELTFFGMPCDDPERPVELPQFMTWAGTVILDGEAYGFVDFPTSPPPTPGEKFFYFSEYWTIFTLDELGVTLDTACDADRVVLQGVNEGRGGPGGTFRADGTIEWADPGGPFAGFAPGSTMFWRGRVTNEASTEFEATFHIRPLR